MAGILPGEFLIRWYGGLYQPNSGAQLENGTIVSAVRRITAFDGPGVEIYLTDPTTQAVTHIPPLMVNALDDKAATLSFNIIWNLDVAALPGGGFAVAYSYFYGTEQRLMLHFFDDAGAQTRMPVQVVGGSDPQWIINEGIMSLDTVSEGVLLTWKHEVQPVNDPARPGWMGQIFSPSGEAVTDTFAFHTNRAYKPATLDLGAEEGILLAFYAQTDSSVGALPAGLYTRKILPDGTLTAPIALNGVAGGTINDIRPKLLIDSEGVIRLVYLDGFGGGGGNDPLALRMVTLDAAGQTMGPPVTLTLDTDSPASPSWRMMGFDAVMGPEDSIIVALETVPQGVQFRDKTDIYVASYNSDGSLRSMPVLATQTETGLQRDPILMTTEDGTIALHFFGQTTPNTSQNAHLRLALIDPEDVPPLAVTVNLALDLPVGVEAGAVILTFTSDDGSVVIEATDNGDGTHTFGDISALSGRITAARDYAAPPDPVITTAHALDVLRIALGREASFGPTEARHFIAADVNGNGSVTTEDALDVLRAALGRETSFAPEFIFLDAGDPLPGLARDATAHTPGIALSGGLATLLDSPDIALQGLILGHVGPFG
ncbi:MAG: hypothetical protein JJU40_01455 [Rhodobacteraceae bacterium]|nr:hypothetical protein [Paracoccaceae bacterium]